MRIFVLAAILCSLFASPSLAQGPYPSPVDPDEAAANLAALQATYDRVARTNLATRGKVVVIRRSKRFIVVSFLPPDKEVRNYGGRFHAVYDPVSRKIVHLLGEE